MRCAAILDLLHPFHDGELEVAENVDFLKHLELCASCRTRSTAEQSLRELVQREAAETASPALRRKLLDGACERIKAESPQRKESTWRRHLPALAAGVLAAVGLCLGYSDPFCWFGCSTRAMVRSASAAVDRHDVVPLAELQERFPGLSDAVPSCEMDCGQGCVWEVAGGGLRPAICYDDPKTKERYAFFTIPDGHAHVGESVRHGDGRDYLRASTKDFDLVGWRDAAGELSCCIGPPGGDLSLLFAMALQVRDSGG